MEVYSMIAHHSTQFPWVNSMLVMCSTKQNFSALNSALNDFNLSLVQNIGTLWENPEIYLDIFTSRVRHGQVKGKIQGVKNKKKKTMFFKNFEASKTSLTIFKAFKKFLTLKN